MNDETHRKIEAFLREFTRKALKDHDINKLKQAYPFHRLFFNERELLASKRERSIVTRMGQELYPKLAKIIAEEKYRKVELEKTIQGDVEALVRDKINEIVQILRTKRRRPDHEEEMKQITELKNKISEKQSKNEKISLKIIADLYIGDFDQGPFFAEIKSPLPNLDICAQSKSKILIFETLKENSRGYLAFPYNPHITRQSYKHRFTEQIMDMQREVLMAEEFWDKIGGEGTFTQLLSIIEEVGNEVRRET